MQHKSEKIDELTRKVNEGDTTMRKLTLQNTQLQAENKRLLDEGQKFANTKLEQTEKERLVLMKQAEEQQKLLSAKDAEVAQLSQQVRALEEQARAFVKLKADKDHLEQKVLSQRAVIQNLEQVHVVTCTCTCTLYMYILACRI